MHLRRYLCVCRLRQEGLHLQDTVSDRWLSVEKVTFDARHIVSLAPGDRTHIPESAMLIYNVLTEQLVHLKHTAPVSLFSFISFVLVLD